MAVSVAVQKLMDEYNRFSSTTMNELFKNDDMRAKKYTIEY